MLKLCANSSKQHHCPRLPMLGHIYCIECYVANRGYYSPNVTLNYQWRAPAAKGAYHAA